MNRSVVQFRVQPWPWGDGYVVEKCAGGGHPMSHCEVSTTSYHKTHEEANKAAQTMRERQDELDAIYRKYREKSHG